MDNREIERKFLLTVSVAALVERYRPRTDPTCVLAHTEVIDQCYLRQTGDWTIRLRRVQTTGRDYPQCYLTMKQRVTDVTCREIESEIYWKEFDRIAPEFSPMLRKRRYHFLVGDQTPRFEWSVDEFLNRELAGLAVAEIELRAEDDEFARPEWLGDEVTSDPSYRNVRLLDRITG